MSNRPKPLKWGQLKKLKPTLRRAVVVGPCARPPGTLLWVCPVDGVYSHTVNFDKKTVGTIMTAKIQLLKEEQKWSKLLSRRYMKY